MKADIRPCDAGETGIMCEIVNDAAQAYRGFVPADLLDDPYMPLDELLAEIEDGVCYWGCELKGELIGIMGIQELEQVTLIRHAYVRTSQRGRGIGSRLLTELRGRAGSPILIGTWSAAEWAIRFYEKHGFVVQTREMSSALLRKYWSISDRQIETSVVLAEPGWLE